jgi:hypothetical protein
MERIVKRLNHIFMTTGMAIIICVLFISCYTLNEFNNSMWIRKSVSTESTTKTAEYYRTSGNMKANKVDWKIEHAKLEFVDMDKYYLNSILKIYGSSQLILFSIIIIFILLILSFRVWRIKISKSKNNLLLVHYIQSKDGKKDALSTCYIF